jgi:4'-phosphopantetheinyl transferase
MALFALAPTRVGVDVEVLPPYATVAKVTGLLHPRERDEVLSASPSERASRFARLWARKEAYLKGIGTGVTTDLAVQYLGTEQTTGGPPGWAVLDIPVPDGYAAAAAARATARGYRRGTGWRSEGPYSALTETHAPSGKTRPL